MMTTTTRSELSEGNMRRSIETIDPAIIITAKNLGTAVINVAVAGNNSSCDNDWPYEEEIFLMELMTVMMSMMSMMSMI